MTANHYETLGVAPRAEDAVIRAAYRALMRRYHPDANADPQAQALVREITAAFHVLGNPARRAAYDALPHSAAALWSGNPPWLDAGPRGPPPMRNIGLAAVALAFGLSLTVALWPASKGPLQPAPSSTATSGRAATFADRVDPPEEPVVDADVVGTAVADVSDYADLAVPQPRASARPAGQPTGQPEPAPVREVTQSPAPRVEAPRPVTPTAREVPGRGATAVGQTDQAQALARMAAGFLQQSLTHADWKKQQLLLSAQVRSNTSRKLCRSDGCVTEVYLRQMRETTAIMEGRIPGQ